MKSGSGRLPPTRLDERMSEITRDLDLTMEAYGDEMERGERIIRAVLLVGFLGVLALEAWLLWRWIQLLA